MDPLKSIPSKLSLGKQFNLTNYRILDPIGSGSYASVYRGREVRTNEIVAIKCVEKSRLTPTGIENIITEIKMMKMLDHEFIVKMKEFQTDDNFIYIILEYCDGGDLSTFIKRHQKLPEKVVQKFMRELALGLQFLRSKNISHLDLKPQNLLLKKQPLTLKIADFGFAQFLSEHVRHTNIRGSPLYMAPEMLLRQSYDVKADLWSVGVIAYECLFGKPPFSFKTCQELIECVRAQVFIEIPEGSVTIECKSLLVGLLEYNPAKRMDYKDFFEHPFLDLEYYPSDISYGKAVEILHQAVKLDTNKSYEEAFYKYCHALRYLLPYAYSLPPHKRQEMVNKVHQYTNRAEELKGAIFNVQGKSKSNEKCNYRYDPNKDRLKKLSASTPKMASAIDIGFTAQMYLVEEDYKRALQNFEMCLGVLIPLLSTEPPGERRELLIVQVQLWLKQAENAKVLMDVREYPTKSSDASEYCAIQ